MRRMLALPLMAALFALGYDASAADKEKAEKEEKKDERVTYGSTLTGQLKNVNGTDKTITVSVTVRYALPNPQAGAQALQQRLQMLQYQRQLMTAPPWQRQQILWQMMRQGGGGGGVQWQTATQDFEFQPAEDMKVRMASPPPQLDENGKPKRYTAKELRELRGNGALPGYRADVDALRDGQTVTVYIAKPAKKKKGEDELNDKQQANMVVIVAEPAPMP